MVRQTNHQGHAGAADSAMARKKNSRCVVSTEPEGDIVLRSAKLKQISGRDPIQVRELFKSSFNFVAKFKLFLQTNKQRSWNRWSRSGNCQKTVVYCISQ